MPNRALIAIDYSMDVRIRSRITIRGVAFVGKGTLSDECQRVVPIQSITRQVVGGRTMLYRIRGNERVHSRPAFTLVELLAVIAIIGTLVGLLLPAVQAAREAARRSSCSSKLRQIALGVINYQDASRRFPPGAVQSNTACQPPEYNAGSNPTVRRASWTVWILPFVEEAAMYTRMNPTSTSTRFGALLTSTTGEDSTNLAAQNTPLSIYKKCPSDIAQRATQPSLNYFGVQGGGAEADAACRNGSTSNYRLRFDNGILTTQLTTDAAISAAKVTDGLSKTFLVGESRWWSYDYTNVLNGNYFGWSSSNRPNTWAQPLVLAAAVDPINNPLVDYDASQAWGTTATPTNAVYLGTHTRCFGSRHPGGCHMAMADGSVQFVSNSISTTIYRQLGTRADGQPMGAIE